IRDDRDDAPRGPSEPRQPGTQNRRQDDPLDPPLRPRHDTPVLRATRGSAPEDRGPRWDPAERADPRRGLWPVRRWKWTNLAAPKELGAVAAPSAGLPESRQEGAPPLRPSAPSTRPRGSEALGVPHCHVASGYIRRAAIGTQAHV